MQYITKAILLATTLLLVGCSASMNSDSQADVSGVWRLDTVRKNNGEFQKQSLADKFTIHVIDDDDEFAYQFDYPICELSANGFQADDSLLSITEDSANCDVELISMRYTKELLSRLLAGVSAAYSSNEYSMNIDMGSGEILYLTRMDLPLDATITKPVLLDSGDLLSLGEEGAISPGIDIYRTEAEFENLYRQMFVVNSTKEPPVVDFENDVVIAIRIGISNFSNFKSIAYIAETASEIIVELEGTAYSTVDPAICAQPSVSLSLFSVYVLKNTKSITLSENFFGSCSGTNFKLL